MTAGQSVNVTGCKGLIIIIIIIIIIRVALAAHALSVRE